METKFFVLVAILAFCVLSVAGNPFWKVFCNNQPIYRGRADTIVTPGAISGHSHKVFGASNFNPGSPSRTPIDEYNILQQSSCTTCSISIDKSNYWVPDLYYKNTDGTFSVVQNGGLTVYYPSRSGSGAQANPTFTAVPPGLRMLAGSPSRRTYNASSLADQAISWACIGVSGPQTPGFPADPTKCSYGLRAQIWFPMCWNGVDLDSPSHTTHMSYPDHVDGGNCPSTHPVRLPGIFYEVLFSVSNFKPQAKNPFVLSCGDPTGYGLHGDFLNGWDQHIMQQALNDPTCFDTNTNNGNNVKACNTFNPYVVDNTDGCLLTNHINHIEDLGQNHPITALPGCNPINPGPGPSPGCTSVTTQAAIGTGWQRFLLRPWNSKLFVGAPTQNDLLNANVVVPYYSEVWTMTKFSNGWAIQSDLFSQYLTSANGDPLICNRNSPSSWETFVFVKQSTGFYAIQAMSNNKYITLHADGTLHGDSATITSSALWALVDPTPYALAP